MVIHSPSPELAPCLASFSVIRLLFPLLSNNLSPTALVLVLLSRASRDGQFQSFSVSPFRMDGHPDFSPSTALLPTCTPHPRAFAGMWVEPLCLISLLMGPRRMQSASVVNHRSSVLAFGFFVLRGLLCGVMGFVGEVACIQCFHHIFPSDQHVHRVLPNVCVPRM